LKYFVTINKRAKYVKVYSIVKRVNQNTNFVSEFLRKLVERYTTKGERMKKV
jgi:hypothetical protein